MHTDFCPDIFRHKVYSYLQIIAIWLEKVVKGLDCTAWKLTTIDKNRLTVLASVEEKRETYLGQEVM